jgi:hypothetical protein
VSFYLIRNALVAALGGLLFGFDTAVIAGTTRQLTALFELSPAMFGVTVSLALWGTVLGSILAAGPAARSGAVPFVFFAIMMAVRFVVVLNFYPETAGIRLESLEGRLGGGEACLAGGEAP